MPEFDEHHHHHDEDEECDCCCGHHHEHHHHHHDEGECCCHDEDECHHEHHHHHDDDDECEDTDLAFVIEENDSFRFIENRKDCYYINAHCKTLSVDTPKDRVAVEEYMKKLGLA